MAMRRKFISNINTKNADFFPKDNISNMDINEVDMFSTLQKQDLKQDYKIISMPNCNIKEAIDSIVSPQK